MFVYKIDVLKELKAAGYSTARLRKEKLLGERSIQLIRHREMVGIIALERLCEMLDMQPGDIIYYMKEENS